MGFAVRTIKTQIPIPIEVVDIKKDNIGNKISIYVDSYDINKFISSISLPRKVLVLVPSGPSLDEVISLCIKNLNSNDILIDAGNTNPTISFENHQKIKSKN